MKYLIILLTLFTFSAHADEVTIANGKITITDIEALLEAAEEEQVVTVIKASLWNEFQHPPILIELAKQNAITVVELIDILEKEYVGEWNPYTALKELDDVFDSLPHNVGPEAARDLLKIVTDEIINEITDAILRRG